jgi:hypothetical protein
VRTLVSLILTSIFLMIICVVLLPGLATGVLVFQMVTQPSTAHSGPVEEVDPVWIERYKRYNKEYKP